MEKDQLLEDLFRAYFDARRNKRNTTNQLRFELNFESNILKLYQDITSRTYEINPSICFMVNHPVKREIFAADFRDRVIHHLLYNYINPYFDSLFIEDSYSCRKGKGTLYGVKRVANFIKECSSNYSQDCYVLKLDIEGYFMNIDKELLRQVTKKYLNNDPNADVCYDKDLVFYLLDCVLNDDPTINCKIKGSRSDWDGLPITKSLFCKKKGQGLPIGNLTSQLFSNIYLHDFDCYVKNKLRMNFYGRYVDDFVIVHRDPKQLKRMLVMLSEYLQKGFRLKVHPKKIYLQHYTKGVNFLGSIIKPHRLYITNRTKKKFRNVVKQWKNHLENNPQIDTDSQYKLMTCINSYLGVMSHYRTFNIRKEIMLSNNISNILRYGYIKHKPYKSMYFALCKKTFNREQNI